MINWKQAQVYKGFLLGARRIEKGYIPVLIDEKGYHIQVSLILSRPPQTYTTDHEAISVSQEAAEKMILKRKKQSVA